MTLAPGKMVFLSEIGHRNFFYPSRKRARINKEAFVSKLPWIKIHGLTPCLVDPADIGLDSDGKKVAIWVSI